MNIFVCVKRVPDTESKIRIDHSSNRIIEDGLNFVMSPYDEYAVEEALRIREAKGGKVTVFSVGPSEALVTLKKALAMGSDEAVLIQDGVPETYDGLRVAKILARVFEQKYTEVDLILFGKQAMGSDNAQVPAMVAELLGLPQANVVTKLAIEGNSATAHREIEGASEILTLSLPAVLSAQKGLNEPRYETLKGIMTAKRKEIPMISVEDLNFGTDEIAPQMELVKLESPPPRDAGQVIEVEPEEAAKKLVDFLHNEAKVI